MADKKATNRPPEQVEPAQLRADRGTDTAVAASPASLPDAIEAEVERTRRRAETREPPVPHGPFRSGRELIDGDGRRPVVKKDA